MSPDPADAFQCPAPWHTVTKVPVVALLLLAAPGTSLALSLLALIRLTAHAKNVQVGAEEMEKP